MQNVAIPACFSQTVQRELELNPQLRNMPESAPGFSLLIHGPCVLWELPAGSWKAAGTKMWMGNVDCSSGASASVGHLPIKSLGKSNDSTAISQEFLESLSSQASSVPCSSLCSQQLHQQDDFSHPGGGNAVPAAVQMCTE